MDNLTHALVGLVLADAVALALPRPPSAKVRGMLRLASAVANNLPDLDFLYSRITPGKLGYLLHHRGHTHTLLVGVVLGALTFALARAWARRRSFDLTGAETRALGVLSLLGPWAHVGMDALNNYGVHPFWPAFDGWLYGDTVFIIEPWFWVFSIPPLALSSTTKIGRITLGFCLAAGLAFAWMMPLVGGVAALVLTVSSALCVVASLRFSEQGRALLGLGGCLAVIVGFGAASRLARAELLDAVRTRAPPGEPLVSVVDAVLTPGPASPICWQAVVVGRQRDRYVLEVAMVSIAPWLEPASSCRLEPIGASVGLQVSRRRSTERVLFQGEHRTELAALRHLARSNCHVAAFLGFARAPFWVDHGATLELGDLRYDRSTAAGFAELDVPARPGECPPWIPPWTPPRADLLE